MLKHQKKVLKSSDLIQVNTYYKARWRPQTIAVYTLKKNNLVISERGVQYLLGFDQLLSGNSLKNLLISEKVKKTTPELSKYFTKFYKKYIPFVNKNGVVAHGYNITTVLSFLEKVNILRELVPNLFEKYSFVHLGSPKIVEELSKSITFFLIIEKSLENRGVI